MRIYHFQIKTVFCSIIFKLLRNTPCRNSLSKAINPTLTPKNIFKLISDYILLQMPDNQYAHFKELLKSEL